MQPGPGQQVRIECSVADCTRAATVYVIDVQRGSDLREQFLCEAHLGERLARYATVSAPSDVSLPTSTGRAPFEVALIVCHIEHRFDHVYLRESGGQRNLILSSGPDEAAAIWQSLKLAETPRPLTHDAILNVIAGLGGVLQHVSIHDYVSEGEYFIASLCVRQGEIIREIDVRPSDAICVAIRGRAPIYVTGSALSRAAAKAHNEVDSGPAGSESLRPGRVADVCEVHPRPPNDPREVFFSGQYRHRKPGSLKWRIAGVGLGAFLCAFASNRLLSSRDDAAMAAAMILLLLFSVPLLGASLSWLWAWVTNRIDRLEISLRGITYGRNHWSWGDIARVRIGSVKPGIGSWYITIWTHKDRRTAGHSVLVDGAITPEAAAQLVEDVKRCSRAAGHEVVCERS